MNVRNQSICRQIKKLVHAGLLSALAVGMFILFFAYAVAANQTEKNSDVQTILMNKVLELAKTRPLTLEKIEKSFHVRLVADTQNTNRYTRFYTATAQNSPNGLESVEVRFPTSAAAKQRMIILLLNSSLGLTASEVSERVGVPGLLQVKRPADPEGTSYTYRLKTAELRFGILREPNDRVRTIVLEWEE